EDGQDLLPGRRVAVFGSDVQGHDCVARRVQALGDELVLAAEFSVERALGYSGRLAYQVDADSADAAGVEQVGGGVDKPLPGRRRGRMRHGSQLTSRASVRKQIGVRCFQVNRSVSN